MTVLDIVALSGCRERLTKFVAGMWSDRGNNDKAVAGGSTTGLLDTVVEHEMHIVGVADSAENELADSMQPGVIANEQGVICRPAIDGKRLSLVLLLMT